MSEGMVAIWVFGWVTVFLFIHFVRLSLRDRQIERIHKERMLAMEKGIPLPELPAMESHCHRGARSDNPRWPLGLGGLLITLGIGNVAALIISTDPEIQKLWTLPITVIFLGAGFILYYFLTKPRSN